MPQNFLPPFSGPFRDPFSGPYDSRLKEFWDPVYQSFLVGASIWDPAASVFTAGTYAWTVWGANTIANVANELVITWVDNQLGARNNFADAWDLSSNLTVGQLYRFKCDAKYTGGNGCSLQQVRSGGSDTSVLTTAMKQHVITFTADHATSNRIQQVGMGAGETVNLDNMYLAPQTKGIGTGSWIPLVNNVVDIDTDGLFIKFVDSALGARTYFRASTDLLEDLPVGEDFVFSCKAKTTGSVGVQVYDGASAQQFGEVNSATWVPVSIPFTANHASNIYLYFYNMGGADVIWLKDLSIKG